MAVLRAARTLMAEEAGRPGDVLKGMPECAVADLSCDMYFHLNTKGRLLWVEGETSTPSRDMRSYLL